MALKLKMAEPLDVRLKMYIYGESGTGKTVTSLHFPNPLVIDTEGGTDHYAKFFKFYREKTSDPQQVKNLIDDLIEDPQGIKTLVIDPFSVIYDNILLRHESRMKVKSGNPNYTLQPADYKFIRAEVKGLVLRMLSLDMNIIVTARSATEYSKEEFMKIVGTKAEGPKDLPYMFDIVLELTNVDGKFIANVKKDRTNTLPPTFEFSYESFVKHLGIDGLEREPVAFKQKLTLNATTGRQNTVTYNGVELKTAGITSENLAKLAELVSTFGEEATQLKLREEYYIDSILDLKNDEAELFIKNLNTLIENGQIHKTGDN